MSESQTEPTLPRSVGQVCRDLAHAADNLAAAGLMYDTLNAVVDDDAIDNLVLDEWDEFTKQLEATAKVIDAAFNDHPPEEATPDE